VNNAIKEVGKLFVGKVNETEQLKELNFITENKVREMDSLIRKTSDNISLMKKLDFFQENEREIFVNNNKEHEDEMNNELKCVLDTLNKKIAVQVKTQNNYKDKLTELNELKENLKKKIQTEAIYMKYFVDTSKVIVEDDNEKTHGDTTILTNRINNKKHYRFMESLDLVCEDDLKCFEDNINNNNYCIDTNNNKTYNEIQKLNFDLLKESLNNNKYINNNTITKRSRNKKRSASSRTYNININIINNNYLHQDSSPIVLSSNNNNNTSAKDVEV
jgi:hypothetical protein